MDRAFTALLVLGFVPSSLSEVEHACPSLLQVKQHISPQPSPPDPGEGESKSPMLVPPQLIMTGPYVSLDTLPAEAAENLKNTQSHAQGLKIRYFNDDQCLSYLTEHFSASIANFFNQETLGAYRGDLCRTAILSREGGFYVDMDFELHTPLLSLIDEHTTLMTAFAAAESGPVILNALIAVQPNSPVMKVTMERLEKWYQGPRLGLPGPLAMAEAISQMMQQNCPDVYTQVYLGRSTDAAKATALGGFWKCSSESLRLYQEEFFGSGQSCLEQGAVVCPPARANSAFFGLGYGVFSIGQGSRETRLVGWPRYTGCAQAGCGMTPAQRVLTGADIARQAESLPSAGSLPASLPNSLPGRLPVSAGPAPFPAPAPPQVSTAIQHMPVGILAESEAGATSKVDAHSAQSATALQGLDWSPESIERMRAHFEQEHDAEWEASRAFIEKSRIAQQPSIEDNWNAQSDMLRSAIDKDSDEAWTSFAATHGVSTQ